MLSAVVALAPALQADPVQRMKTHLAGRNDYAFDYTYESNFYGTGKGRFAWSLPNGQQFDITTKSGHYSMSQRRDGTYFVDHTAKVYWEYRAFPKLAPPSEDIEVLGPAYPQIIVSIAQGTEAKWQVTKGQTFNGAAADRLTANFPIQDAQVPVTLYVGQTGAIIGLTATAEIQGGVSTLKLTLANHDIAKQHLADTDFVLPVGCMPGRIPNMQRPLRSGYKAPLASWTEAKSGKTRNLAREFKGKKFAVLFTAPDCKVSAAAEPVWRQAAAVIKSAGGTLVEVSLGPTKPDLGQKDPARTTFTDLQGKIEADWQPPVTPYLFFVREDGLVTRAWAGYGKDQKETFLKFCKTGFLPGAK